MNKKGFTLIELLVVIAIMGILTAFAATSVIGARRGARDSRRLGDIKNIMSALEQYHNDNGSYPNTNGSVNSKNNEGNNWITGLATYMDRVPLDPQNDNSVTTCVLSYSYLPERSAQGYLLDYTLEKADDNKALGTQISEDGCVVPKRRYRVTR